MEETYKRKKQTRWGCCGDGVVREWLGAQDTLDVLQVLETHSFPNFRNNSKSLPPPVTRIYLGNIRTMVEGNTESVEALGINGGKVVGVGSEEDVRGAMEGLDYDVVCLEYPHTILPGFVEPHAHIVGSAVEQSWNNFGPFDGQRLKKNYCPELLKEQIAEAESKLEIGEIILGYSLDPSLMPFEVQEDGLNKLFTLQSEGYNWLDEEIETDRAIVIISASGHTVYVNTPAMKIIWNKGASSAPPGVKSFEDFQEYVNCSGGLQEAAGLKDAIKSIPSSQLAQTLVQLFPQITALLNTVALISFPLFLLFFLLNFPIKKIPIRIVEQ